MILTCQRPADNMRGMSAGITSRFAITTPELVTFHRRPAELPTRAVAWILDQLIIMVLRIATAISLFQFGEIGFALLFIVLLLIDFGYFTLLEWKYAGQTLGKRMMKIRVASVSGARLEPGDILLRNLLRPIDSLPLTMVLGGVIAWLHPHRRRLGDLAAGTLVIRDAQAQIPDAVFDSAGRINTFQADPTVRSRILARVSLEERDLLMDMAQRRDQLDPLPREKLFADAAAYFRDRLALPESDHLTDEQTVLNVALVLRDPRGR